MDWYTFAAVMIALLSLSLKFARTFRAEPQVRALDRFARESGLALTAEVRPALVRRLTARERGYTIGAMTSVVGIGLWSITGATVTWSGIVLVAIIGLGAVLGLAVAEWRGAFRPVPDQPRLARSTIPTVADYVSPWQLWAPAVTVLIALSALGSVALASPAGLPSLGLAAGLTATAIAAVVASRFARAELVRRGQPAASVTELTWDDALRSAALRGTIEIPTTLGMASLSATLLALGLTPGLGNFVTWALFGVVAALIVFVLVINRRRATTYYLRRLWPEAAADYADAVARGAAR
ncbi:hypothetical protein D6T64_12635 [Cryobacterium melibiosiphilum]|uniref:Uncharacterized protein n=1 Tax=Cryobacterium melibiosiphilum TaxID=995039 RepID=A0A3A5MRA1_9MICO|nr:hypothetical protein [Cryobacterium melibiosiphilum]RJT87934.1 hypothetical protein D6T64_12635 [Cryobacterium melibiosiphilum]